MIKFFRIVLLLLISQFSFSQLELKEIMKGNEFIGHQPQNISWSADGKMIYFSWNPENKPGNSVYQYSPSTNKIEKVALEDLYKIIYADDVISAGKLRFLSQNGNLYSYDLKSNTKKPLIVTNERIYNVSTINNGKKLSFQQGKNIYFYCIESGSISQITNFKEGNKPDNTKKEKSFLEKQQTELFEFINIEQAKTEYRKEIRNAFKTKGAKEIYIGKQSVSNLTTSDDGKAIYFRLNTYPKSKNTQTEYHVTKDGYASLKDSRPKVGKKNPLHAFGVYNVEKDTIIYFNFSALTGIKTPPAYLKEYSTDIKELENPKEIIMHGPVLGEETLLEIKSYDNKDRWICSINADGIVKEINHQHDDAWIGGPGISSWNMAPGTIGWFDDKKTAYFQSEKTGYSHLYTYTPSTNKIKQLTTGKFEIHDIIVAKDDKSLIITANKNHPGNREVYTLDLQGNLSPILTKNGNHEISINPISNKLAVRYSYKDKPWELYTSKLERNAELKQITSSQTKEFKDYAWKQPEVITYKAEDGIDVYARVYQPTAEKNNGAGIVFVHGAGYLQNAHNWWSGYYREYMFHNLLVDLGYTVLDIDYRASKGYGRDYRTAIYQHMGGKDLSDQVDGKKLLVEKYGVDENRVGMYGGSYGGFITLMAMLTTPTEFKSGAAIRSVTDWAHYNHAYTSNILNTPETDPKAFERSSPIYFADNLKGDLLMLHGMVDDNVQFMDVTRLSQRFIELGKENWEMAIYPVEPHGFVHTSSWVDEYGRILKLFNATLLK